MHCSTFHQSPSPLPDRQPSPIHLRPLSPKHVSSNASAHTKPALFVIPLKVSVCQAGSPTSALVMTCRICQHCHKYPTGSIKVSTSSMAHASVSVLRLRPLATQFTGDPIYQAGPTLHVHSQSTSSPNLRSSVNQISRSIDSTVLVLCISILRSYCSYLCFDIASKLAQRCGRD
jgi:hypothetical protein